MVIGTKCSDLEIKCAKLADTKNIMHNIPSFPFGEVTAVTTFLLCPMMTLFPYASCVSSNNRQQLRNRIAILCLLNS